MTIPYYHPDYASKIKLDVHGASVRSHGSNGRESLFTVRAVPSSAPKVTMTFEVVVPICDGAVTLKFGDPRLLVRSTSDDGVDEVSYIIAYAVDHDIGESFFDNGGTYAEAIEALTYHAKEAISKALTFVTRNVHEAMEARGVPASHLAPVITRGITQALDPISTWSDSPFPGPLTFEKPSSPTKKETPVQKHWKPMEGLF